MSITKVTAYPRINLSFNAQAYGFGDKVEILGERNIALVGEQPTPHKYLRLDVHEGANEVKHHISDSVKWTLNVSKQEADEHIAAAEAAPAAHGKKSKAAK